MNKEVNVYSFYDECYVYLGDYKNLLQENIKLKEDYNKVVHESTEFESKVYDLQERIEKAIEILKLCNSKCAKETIEILKGKNE